MGRNLLAVFRSRRMLVLFLLGFGSGLPYYLTANTLQAWLTSVKVDLSTIATLNAIGLAYTFKFLWAPVFDRFALPFLGRRRGWLVVLQLALIAAIVALGATDPIAQPAALAGLALVVAILSASQDIVIDAYTTDLLPPAERAAGASASIVGYRTGMLLTGALALVLADHVSWTVAYAAVAALLVPAIVATLVATEPPPQPPITLAQSLYLPLVDLVRRRHIVLLLAFVVLFKFGDYFAQSLIMPFLTQTFSLTDIAAIYKGLGFVGTVLGGLCAGALVARYTLRRVLLAFGLAQAVTNLLYASLAVSSSTPLFIAAVLVDTFANAMGTAAFVGFLMSLCTPSVSATQFALLTSLSSLGQRVFGALFAYHVVSTTDWATFFALTSAMAVPGLVMVLILGRRKLI